MRGLCKAQNQIYSEDLRYFCYSGNYTWNVGHDFAEKKNGSKVLLKQGGSPGAAGMQN